MVKFTQWVGCRQVSVNLANRTWSAVGLATATGLHSGLSNPSWLVGTTAYMVSGILSAFIFGRVHHHVGGNRIDLRQAAKHFDVEALIGRNISEFHA